MFITSFTFIRPVKNIRNYNHLRFSSAEHWFVFVKKQMDSKENTEKKDGKGNSTSTDVRPAHQRGLCPTPTEEQMHSLRQYSVYMCICEYSAVL